MDNVVKLRRRRSGERGASLVEFALLAPLLILLLLGIVEFGWGVAQQLDARHMAREALRVAVVDGTEAEIKTRVCNNDIIDDASVVEIRNLAATGLAGDLAGVRIVADLEQITGFFGWAWAGNTTIQSEAFGRIEQPTTEWVAGTVSTCP